MPSKPLHATTTIKALSSMVFLAETPDDFTSPSPLKDGFVVDENSIPTGQNVFFNSWKHATPLPSPAEVRQAANGPNHIKGSVGRQQVICFPNLQLIVKYGDTKRTTVSEGQNLWLLSFLPDMRVPKVYGWCVDGDQRFLYMERVEGVTVEERWPSLSASEKLAVAKQLDSMISSMRRLKQAPGNRYIGQFPSHVFHFSSLLRLFFNRIN